MVGENCAGATVRKVLQAAVELRTADLERQLHEAGQKQNEMQERLNIEQGAKAQWKQVAKESQDDAEIAQEDRKQAQKELERVGPKLTAVIDECVRQEREKDEAKADLAALQKHFDGVDARCVRLQQERDEVRDELAKANAKQAKPDGDPIAGLPDAGVLRVFGTVEPEPIARGIKDLQYNWQCHFARALGKPWLNTALMVVHGDHDHWPRTTQQSPDWAKEHNELSSFVLQLVGVIEVDSEVYREAKELLARLDGEAPDQQNACATEGAGKGD